MQGTRNQPLAETSRNEASPLLGNNQHLESDVQDDIESNVSRGFNNTDSRNLSLDIHFDVPSSRSGDSLDSSENTDNLDIDTNAAVAGGPERTSGPTNPNNNNGVETEYESFTNRLRYVFFALYLPSIPLSGLLALILFKLTLVAITSSQCSHSLREFTFVSIIILAYGPYHKRVKRYLFDYDRLRDGNQRPRSVRLYDQVFYWCWIMYLYYDMTLAQLCQDDTSLIDNQAISTCETTCGELYTWFQRFDFVLRIFIINMVLPLVTIPFVYCWILRRVGSIGPRPGNDFLAGDTLVKDVMDGLHEVKLFFVNDETTGVGKVRVRGKNNTQTWSGTKLFDKEALRECCICMTEFQIEDVSNLSKEEGDSMIDDCIVETRCGHHFHKSCLGHWIGGENWELAITDDARARRKCCPLCRKDLTFTSDDTV